jgi:hypothetical protein
MVGLIPLFAVKTLDPELLERVPEFKKCLEWHLNYRPDLASLVSYWDIAAVFCNRCSKVIQLADSSSRLSRTGAARAGSPARLDVEAREVAAEPVN